MQRKGFLLARSGTKSHQLLAFPKRDLQDQTCILFSMRKVGKMTCFKVTIPDTIQYFSQNEGYLERKVALSYRLILIAETYAFSDENYLFLSRVIRGNLVEQD